MNRREFIRLLAASAAAGTAADCQESAGALTGAQAGALERPVDFDGRLVGERFGPCHRLRDGQLGLPPLGAAGAVEADEPLRDVIVIGAGLSGLAAAWALQRSGTEDFVVLERSDAMGGVSLGGSVAGHPCPWGAHYIGLPDPDSPLIVRLLTDLGVIDDFTADHRPIVAAQFRMRKPDVNL
ncbi:MAG: FAD/NAD(P)-binding protein, partial [bacterium]